MGSFVAKSGSVPNSRPWGGRKTVIPLGLCVVTRRISELVDLQGCKWTTALLRDNRQEEGSNRDRQYFFKIIYEPVVWSNLAFIRGPASSIPNQNFNKIYKYTTRYLSTVWVAIAILVSFHIDNWSGLEKPRLSRTTWKQAMPSFASCQAHTPTQDTPA